MTVLLLLGYIAGVVLLPVPIARRLLRDEHMHDERGMAAFMGVVAALLWPVAVPLGAAVGLVMWLLQSAPEKRS